MNKTEYMNTLNEELMGLPVHVIEETMRFYENQFSEGLANGKSELEIVDALPKPRLVAAQKKAGAQYQQFKTKMTPNHFVSLLFALMGVLVFNFFMIVPAMMYGLLLIGTYIASFALYGSGVVMMAVSLAGVPQVQLTLPGYHQHRYSTHHSFQQGNHHESESLSQIIEEDNSKNHHQARNFSINLNEKGVVVVKEDGQISSVTTLEEGDDVFQNHRREKYQKTINIKNKLEKHHAFYGFALLLLGIGLLIFCLYMTKMTFVWFRKYLLWNLSILRAPVKNA